MPRTIVIAALAVGLAAAAPAAAQRSSSAASAGGSSGAAAASADTSERDERPPRAAYGVTAGSLDLGDGAHEQAVSAILQLQPLPWLTLSASPGYGRVQTTLDAISGPSRTASRRGPTDIPFGLGIAHGFDDLGWSPSLYASLGATLAPHDSTGVGLGRSAAEAGVGVGVSPRQGLDFSVGASRPLTSNSGNGSLSLESALSLGRATASLGLSAEVGTPDSGATLSRSLAAGVAYGLAGPLTLVLDAGKGLTSDAPGWSFSVGIGTAFAGLSPVSATSPLRRLKHTFGKRATSSSGYGKKGAACTAPGC